MVDIRKVVEYGEIDGEDAHVCTSDPDDGNDPVDVRRAGPACIEIPRQLGLCNKKRPFGL